jgi:hypothetical protein
MLLFKLICIVLNELSATQLDCSFWNLLLDQMYTHVHTHTHTHTHTNTHESSVIKWHRTEMAQHWGKVTGVKSTLPYFVGHNILTNSYLWYGLYLLTCQDETDSIQKLESLSIMRTWQSFNSRKKYYHKIIKPTLPVWTLQRGQKFMAPFFSHVTMQFIRTWRNVFLRRAVVRPVLSWQSCLSHIHIRFANVYVMFPYNNNLIHLQAA